MEPAPRPSGRRETRLLVITVVVSLGMLLLLARFRFPEQHVEPVAAAPPLERLAARATYDELARILRGVDRQVAPAILSVRTTLDPDLAGAGEVARYVPAVRLAPDRAILLAGARRRVQGIAGQTETIADVIAVDNPRGVTMLAVPPGAGLPALWTGQHAITGPDYAAVIEATSAGPAVRPMYYGRVDRVTDARWDEPLLRFSALQQTPPAGSAVFLLDGSFVGLGIPDEQEFLVVPAAALLRELTRISNSGTVHAGDLGLEVQPLDADLRAVTRAPDGVVITYVTPDGPSDGKLMPGDVIRQIAGRGVASVRDYAAVVMLLAPDQPVPIQAIRRGAPVDVQIVPVTRRKVAARGADQLGLEMRAIRGGGTEVVRVDPLSAASRAGILAGDVITRVDDVENPDPARVAALFRTAPSGSGLLVGLERAGAHVLVVLARP
ncbi:MAG TPA: PDZ domain-containing protein [Vicinamibacterales bacterium]|nr:PDZ domain-containing protein [Vicinamibacterales bacterium]